MSYCVYLKRRQALPVEPVARLLASVTGLTQADGVQMARRCQGFLIEHLDASAARRVVEELGVLGVPAESRQMRDLVANPRVVVVRTADFKPGRFVVQDWKSQDASRAWEDVFALSACCLRELELPESVRRSMAPAPRAGPEARGEAEKPPKKAYLLDFFLREPPTHYRVVHSEFRYDYLGGRLKSSSVANFVSMLHDFDKNASGARRDGGFSLALGGKWDELPGFTALYEVDEYHRWFLQTIPAGGGPEMTTGEAGS